jgi:hypothetical protein
MCKQRGKKYDVGGGFLLYLWLTQKRDRGDDKRKTFATSAWQNAFPIGSSHWSAIRFFVNCNKVTKTQICFSSRLP